MSINSRIKELRLKLNYTQEEFGNRVGVTRNPIMTIENGKNEPSEALLNHMIDIFGVEKEWLYEGKGNMFRDITEDQKLMKVISEAIKKEDHDIKEAIMILHNLSKEEFKIVFKMLKALEKK